MRTTVRHVTPSLHCIRNIWRRKPECKSPSLSPRPVNRVEGQTSTGGHAVRTLRNLYFCRGGTVCPPVFSLHHPPRFDLYNPTLSTGSPSLLAERGTGGEVGFVPAYRF